MIELNQIETGKVAGGGIIDSVPEEAANGATTGNKAESTSGIGENMPGVITGPVTGGHRVTKKIGSGFDGGGGFIGGGISGGSW